MRPRKGEREEGPSLAPDTDWRAQGRAARGQQERICRAPRFQISMVMLECSVWNTPSAETKLRLRAMDLLRERKTVKSVLVGPPAGAPDDRGRGDVLTEEGGEVRGDRI